MLGRLNQALSPPHGIPTCSMVLLNFFRFLQRRHVPILVGPAAVSMSQWCWHFLPLGKGKLTLFWGCVGHPLLVPILPVHHVLVTSIGGEHLFAGHEVLNANGV